MSWLSLIKTLFTAIAAIARLYERHKIEEAAKAKIELEIRDVQDDILDGVSNADVDSVSDEELIERR